VIHNDACYGMLRYDEERRFGRAFAVDLEAPDFAALARSFGLPAWTTDLGAGDFESVLVEALAVDGPSLVEVTGALSPPRVTSARWPLVHGA
jgi:acetolactate synthase-1/2/3 large subunit